MLVKVGAKVTYATPFGGLKKDVDAHSPFPFSRRSRSLIMLQAMPFIFCSKGIQVRGFEG